jgi:predicted dehydrogenase
MADSVGIAFIGTGGISELHAAAVNECRDAHLACVYDVNPERAAAAAQKYGCRTVQSLEELLEAPDVQAVSVLSPVEFHHDHALKVLQAGKHVLIEKPVGMTLAQVQEIAAIARNSPQVCMPGHNYIYEPGVIRIKKMIDTGLYGKVVSAWVIYNVYHGHSMAIKYPGVLRQIITHHFYSLLYLLGTPKRLSALAAETREDKLDREDQVTLILEMGSGALVNLFASFAADDQTSDPWTVLFKVLGTRGGGMYSWRDSVILDGGVGLSWRYPAYESSIAQEVNYFVRRCILDGEPPLSTIEDAVVAQRLIEAAEESIQTGRTITI